MRIEGDCAIIETAEEASVFTPLVGMELWIPKKIDESSRCLVLEAITPKEGDAVFSFTRDDITDIKGDWAPNYCIKKDSGNFDAYMRRPDILHLVKANALTIGKTVGELRDLLTWAKGEA